MDRMGVAENSSPFSDTRKQVNPRTSHRQYVASIPYMPGYMNSGLKEIAVNARAINRRAQK